MLHRHCRFSGDDAAGEDLCTSEGRHRESNSSTNESALEISYGSCHVEHCRRKDRVTIRYKVTTLKQSLFITL